MQTEKPQMGGRVLRRPIWGYSVCLRPIKGTPGLNELTCYLCFFIQFPKHIFTSHLLAYGEHYFRIDLILPDRTYIQRTIHIIQIIQPNLHGHGYLLQKRNWKEFTLVQFKVSTFVLYDH